ncbi:hypothetical protein BS50DRAFT_579640 [Corynespora cassiicola Philippines]|uniref:Uncharacterized protein n=1 Tax=Corynespora cassiicola Philippines TaxID=1448308 RepID=A0A2T2N379_CORCC|nr:hypothetical protein BS50DRAFT_579640 [Corynespora cassiicola Philippines]
MLQGLPLLSLWLPLSLNTPTAQPLFYRYSHSGRVLGCGVAHEGGSEEEGLVEDRARAAVCGEGGGSVGSTARRSCGWHSQEPPMLWRCPGRCRMPRGLGVQLTVG